MSRPPKAITSRAELKRLCRLAATLTALADSESRVNREQLSALFESRRLNWERRAKRAAAGRGHSTNGSKDSLRQSLKTLEDRGLIRRGDAYIYLTQPKLDRWHAAAEEQLTATAGGAP